MQVKALKRIIFNNSGSSLVFVLVLIMILTILTGIILLIFNLQTKIVKQHLFSIQAGYNAESGIYSAIDTLENIPSLRWNNYPYEFDWGDTAYITIRSQGGFIELTSKGVKKNKEKVLRVLIGEIPTSDLEYAIYLMDESSQLTLTGDCDIRGDVRTGPLGAKTNSYKGVIFSGNFTGAVISDDQINKPLINTKNYDELLDNSLQLIDHPQERSIKFHDIALEEIQKVDSLYIYSEEDIIIDQSYQRYFQNPVIIISKKNIILKDTLAFKYGSVFNAQSDIMIEDSVTGEQCIFYAQDEIIMKNNVSCTGQFIARKNITISDSVNILYPSLVCVTGYLNAGIRNGTINISGNSVIEGTIIYANSVSNNDTDLGSIFIDHDATINGVIYSANKIDFNGILDGSLITYELYFYDPPSHYINWLRTGTINIQQRYDHYCLPVNSVKNPRYDIIYYEEL